MTNEQIAMKIQEGADYLTGELWEKNIKFFQLAARRFYILYRNRCDSSGVTEDDIFQCSYFALCDTVKAFDAGSGYKLLTYAKYPLLNHFNALVGWRTAKRDPLNNSTSLNKLTGEDETTELADLQADPESEIPFENVIDDILQVELHKALEAAINKLPDNCAAVIRGRYFEGKPQKELAAEMGVVHQRIGTLQREGLRKLGRNPRLQEFCDEIIDTHAYRGTGYRAFREHLASSVERTVILVEEIEERREGKEID